MGMGEMNTGVMRSIGRFIGIMMIVMVVFAGCTSGGGGGGATSSDEDLKKIADALKTLGEGKWEITTLERNGDVLNISMKVPDDPGKVSFREAQAADEAVHKIMPKASGRLSWVSVQGIGLRTVLLEPVEGSAAPSEEGAEEGGEASHEGHEGHDDM